MSGGKHCYPDSDVLINKYNIRNKELLSACLFINKDPEKWNVDDIIERYKKL